MFILSLFVMFNQPVDISQRNILLVVYIVILCVFGPTVYWINNHSSQSFKSGNKNLIESRVSLGDKILVTAHNNLAKQEGVSAFDRGEYVAAEESFSSALKSDRNDPETRIYLNNTIAAKTKQPVRIAVSVPIGGDLGAAEEILRGVAQAQEQINQRGGINGKLMMVEIANDDNNPELAKQIAEKLVKDQKILAVVGHNDSNASMAAAPIYQDNGLVMITPTSSAEALATAGDYIFRSTPSTRDLSETLAEYTVTVAKKNNIALCIDSEAQVSVSFKENFTWAVYNHGGKINPLNCDLSSANYLPSEIPSQAISMGADALVLAPSVRHVDKVTEIIAANDDRLTLFGNHSMTTYKTLKEGQKDAVGMVLSVPWYSPQAGNSFTKQAEKLWGGGVNWRSAMAYDATQSISKAIATGAKREQIQKALANPEFSASGATTEVNFLPSGDRNLRGTLVTIQPGKKSGTGYDFVPLAEKPTPAIAK